MRRLARAPRRRERPRADERRSLSSMPCSPVCSWGAFTLHLHRPCPSCRVTVWLRWRAPSWNPSDRGGRDPRSASPGSPSTIRRETRLVRHGCGGCGRRPDPRRSARALLSHPAALSDGPRSPPSPPGASLSPSSHVGMFHERHCNWRHNLPGKPRPRPVGLVPRRAAQPGDARRRGKRHPDQILPELDERRRPRAPRKRRGRPKQSTMSECAREGGSGVGGRHWPLLSWLGIMLLPNLPSSDGSPHFAPRARPTGV